MATVRPRLSRLVVGRAQLEWGLKCHQFFGGPFNVNLDNSVYGGVGVIQRRCRSSCFNSFLCEGVHPFVAPVHRLNGDVHAHGSLRLQGLCSAAGDSSGAGSATHVLRVPSMGESITEGTIVQWRKGVGSVVQAEEVICVVETDNVSVDIHSDAPGRIVSIAVDVGNTAVVGGELAVIEPLSPEAAAEAGATSLPKVGLRSTSTGNSSTFTGVSCPKGAEVAETAEESRPQFMHRRPSILFASVRRRLEKLGLVPHEQHAELRSSRPKQGKVEVAERKTGEWNATVVMYKSFEDLPSFLERPALSTEEIEAINDGGVADLDSAAKAWNVSLSFRPASCSMKQKKNFHS